MNKLITALDNNYINEKLKHLNKYEIKYDDISYQEGIFEILEKEEINILLLSEILKGPYDIKELINKIKEKNNKIEIIIILEKKNIDLEKFLLEKNINNYFYNNQLSINDFNSLNFISEKINNNITDLKNIILKRKYNKSNSKNTSKNILKFKLKNNNINNASKNKFIDILKNKKIKNKFKNNEIKNELDKKIINISENKYINDNTTNRNTLKNCFKNNKKYIFSFCGKNGFEKSIFILTLSLILKNKNKKILNIDLDFFDQNINTLFGVEKFPNKNNLNNKILNINKNIDYLSGLEEILNNNYEESIIKINKLKNDYDYILINLASVTNLKLTKKILEMSDYNICIFNNKNKDIIYNNNLLKIYNEEWGINKNKFICFFNNERNNFIYSFSLEECCVEEELKNNYKYFINKNSYINNDIIFNLDLNKYKLDRKTKKQFNKLLECVKNKK